MSVRYADRFRIPFKGLKEGDHSFDFEIDDSFFEIFPESEIKEGSLHTEVILHKSPRMLTFDFFIDGNVRVPCDRCLEMFDLPVSFTYTLYVKFGQERHEESANTLIIPEDDYFLNVSQYVYEFIHLALPLRRVHPDDDNGHPTCDPLMLKKLKELTVTENKMKRYDERWSVLKGFTKNIN